MTCCNGSLLGSYIPNVPIVQLNNYMYSRLWQFNLIFSVLPIIFLPPNSSSPTLSHFSPLPIFSPSILHLFFLSRVWSQVSTLTPSLERSWSMPAAQRMLLKRTSKTWMTSALCFENWGLTRSAKPIIELDIELYWLEIPYHCSSRLPLHPHKWMLSRARV